MQLTFSAALDVSGIMTENMKIYTGTYMAILVLAAYGVYALIEVGMAFVYRSYIIRNGFDKMVE